MIVAVAARTQLSAPLRDTSMNTPSYDIAVSWSVPETGAASYVTRVDARQQDRDERSRLQLVSVDPGEDDVMHARQRFAHSPRPQE